MRPPTHEMKQSQFQDTYDLTGFATVKILVVPVSPQKKESFSNYFNILNKFSDISLAELTPPDSKTGNILLIFK